MQNYILPTSITNNNIDIDPYIYIYGNVFFKNVFLIFFFPNTHTHYSKGFKVLLIHIYTYTYIHIYTNHIFNISIYIHMKSKRQTICPPGYYHFANDPMVTRAFRAIGHR